MYDVCAYWIQQISLQINLFNIQYTYLLINNMHHLTSLIAITTLLAILTTYYSSTHTDLHQFTTWKLTYQKSYDHYTEVYRYAIYLQTRAQVYAHNLKADAGLESYYMGINQFADTTDQEFIATYLQPMHTTTNGRNQVNTTFACAGQQPPEKTVPDAWDWAAKSAVTSVKNLGACTAGYAAVASQSIESGRFVSIGKLVALSPQQIVDCTAEFGNQGCIRGNVTGAYDYVYKKGMASQVKYPWRGFAYNCNYSSGLKEAEILGCVKINSNKEAAIKNAIYRQPLAASINAEKLKNYSKGIYEAIDIISSCKPIPNHWMLLVSYGRDEQKKKNYWKLKNTWGASWGVEGYLYIIRKGDGQGECGVQSQLYYPIA